MLPHTQLRPGSKSVQPTPDCTEQPAGHSSLHTSQVTLSDHVLQQANQTALFKQLKQKTPVVRFSQSHIIPSLENVTRPLIVFMLPTQLVAYKECSSAPLVIHTWLCGYKSAHRVTHGEERSPGPDRPGASPSGLQMDSISGRSQATACDRLMDDVTLTHHCHPCVTRPPLTLTLTVAEGEAGTWSLMCIRLYVKTFL